MIEKNEDFFIKKQEKINRAIKKVQEKLDFFKQRSEENFKDYENMTEEQREKAREINSSCFWNEHHDLHHRLENRLFNNWSDYKDWHWKKYGFNTY